MALAFAGMGLIALAAPARVTGQFGIAELQAAGRHEVRAVYGGFGLVMSGMSVASLLSPGLRTGICLTVGVALLGMTGGAWCREHGTERSDVFPWPICSSRWWVGRS